MQFDIGQFGHLPVWAAILFVAWKLSTAALKAWRELTLARIEADKEERSAHRDERKELVKGFSSVSTSVDSNTQATRELTATVRGFLVDRDAELRNQRRQG